MENSSPSILEISSDEDAGFGDTRKGRDHGIGDGEFCDGEDYDWLSKLLVEVGENKDDDSDEVVVVSEVWPKTPKKSRMESLRPSSKAVGDEADDDDCVVLDGDPDKPVVVVNGGGDEDKDDSDDLEIIGEKGEVACRDFPHPRHLCAKFLFASTPHEVHCGQCHCYVCDLLAPCSCWGTGTSSIDHCHASDKEEYWRAERKRLKKGEKPVPVLRSNSHTSLLQEPIQATQVPALAPAQPNSLTQNQGLRPVTICSYYMPSNVSVSNAVNQPRIYPAERIVPRNKPQSRFVSPQAHATCNNNVASRDKRHNAGSRSAQSFPPHALFKRPGTIGASPNNRQVYGSQLSRGPSLKRCHAFQSPLMNGRYGSNQQNVESHTAHSVLPQPTLSTSQSMNVQSANYIPSQPQIPSRPYSSCRIREIHCQSQMPSQPYVNSNFVSAVPSQPQEASQPSVANFEKLILPQPHVVFQNSPVPYQPTASYQSDAGRSNAFGNELHSRSMISSNHNLGNNFENQCSQPQAHNNPTSLVIDGQNDFQQGNHTQNGIDVIPTDFGCTLVSSLSHGNQQIHTEVSQSQSGALTDESQLQGAAKDVNHQSAPLVDNSHLQSVVLADNSSLISDSDCQFPGSKKPESVDFQFDSWMFENHSLPGSWEIPMSPVWNAYSPEPTSIETGTLFDI